MSFASPLFLWFFTPVVLAAVLVFPRSWRNGIVAVASLVFYAAGAGPSTLLLLGTMVVNFLAGPMLEPDEWDLARRRRKLLLTAVIVVDLGVLIIWKYAGFLTAQLDGFARLFGGDLPVVHVLLPIGISFYTFHHISYAVDIYRGERERQQHRRASHHQLVQPHVTPQGPHRSYLKIAKRLLR